MNRAYAILMMFLGLLMLLVGIRGQQNGEAATAWVFGEPVDRSFWLLVVGVLFAATGIAGDLYGRRYHDQESSSSNA